MRRQTLLRAAGCMVALAAGGFQAACSASGLNGRSLANVSPDAPVLSPARQLGLTLADLPAGFQLKEELAPVFPAGGAEDPWGRLTAYSATYAPIKSQNATTEGDVVSSVNSYASASYARSAFAQWQAAVPTTYRKLDVGMGMKGVDSVAYERDGGSLIGFRSHNVLASVLVTRAGSALGNEKGAIAPDTAMRLARQMAARIEAGLK
jgi:hypothetical protein